MDVFGVRGELVDDYRAYTGSVADIRDRRIREHVGEVPSSPAADFAEHAMAGLPQLRADLDRLGDDHAERFRSPHLRVRAAAGRRVRRQVAVRSQKPADVLGVCIDPPMARSGSR
jgi:hypothetical protein